jgi:hypothetical protein
MRCAKFVSLFTLALLMPALAFAQASITGVIRDTSGGVLPGVSVEAASPSLIEKTRTVVSDAGGQYRIEELRPGTYSVTFAIEGFNSLKRDGIELTGSFTATVNVELKVGTLAETVTVTGASPIVDVQSARQQRVIGREVLDAIPTGRTPYTAGVLIPGMNTNQLDLGGTNTLSHVTLSSHGGRATDQRVMLEGMSTANADGTGYIGASLPNEGSIQEVTIDYAAGTAEQSTGGVVINLIPKEGGNDFKGMLFVTGANSSFQGSNLTQSLKDRGLQTATSIKALYDINPAFGGPIVRDKLWLYTTARWNGASNYVGNMYYNVNAGNPAAWTYVPDFSRPAFFPTTQTSFNGRITWQLNAKNKLGFFYDSQYRCWCDADANWVSTSVSPEAAPKLRWPFQRNAEVTWSSPLTSRLLLEAGFLNRGERFAYTRPPASDPILEMIPVIEQAGVIPGILYRGACNQNPLQLCESAIGLLTNVRVATSYITGAHALKVGFSNRAAERTSTIFDNNYNMNYRFSGGVPNLISERATPYSTDRQQPWDLGLYVQDKWTLNRMTVNAGLRFDYWNNYFPANHLGPTRLTPTRDFTLPETDWVHWKDLTPRLGLAYDLFGNGKTAIKVSLNKYMLAFGSQGAFGDAADPVNRLATYVSRSWDDRGGRGINNDYIPQCDLTSPLANGECGAMSDRNFGNATLTTTYDPATLVGWGQRGYNWEFSTSVQQELTPRMSMNVGYFRRLYGNFIVTDNRAVAATDFSPFSLIAPVDPRLPGGGGNLITNLYNLNPNKVGAVDNYFTFASNYGEQIEHWNGVDVSMNARLRQGALVQGGFSTGRTVTDNCAVAAQLPELNPTNIPYCHVVTQFLTQIKLLGTYTIPKIDVQLASTFQSIPGPQVAANFNAPNSLVAPSLGRPLSGGAANVSVNLVAPGTMYGERLNQLDLRFSKILKFSRTRTSLNLDIYNVMNSSAVLTQNNTYTTTAWQQPLSILQARFAKISVQADF